MRAGRELRQRLKVAFGSRLEGVDVVVPVSPGHDDGQIIVLHQVPGDESPRDAVLLT